MHFDGKMKNNRRKIERGLGILPYGNSTTQTIGKCGGFRLCHDTGSACYGCLRHSQRVWRMFKNYSLAIVRLSEYNHAETI